MCVCKTHTFITNELRHELNFLSYILHHFDEYMPEHVVPQLVRSKIFLQA